VSTDIRECCSLRRTSPKKRVVGVPKWTPREWNAGLAGLFICTLGVPTKNSKKPSLQSWSNNHDSYRDWCKAALGTEEEVRQTGLWFRCKVRNKELYLFLKKHHNKLMVDAKLWQLYHQHDTNNVEGFNKFLTNFLTKDRTYCQTIENKTRSLLAVGLQSIGCRQLYNRVFALTGINLRDDDITNLFFCSEDAEKLRKKLHQRKESVKITRMREFY
jgi:hypothetical protein